MKINFSTPARESQGSNDGGPSKMLKFEFFHFVKMLDIVSDGFKSLPKLAKHSSGLKTPLRHTRYII